MVSTSAGGYILESRQDIVTEDYIGSILNACRNKADLSQEKLAELLYCSRSTISKIETNSQKIKFDLFVHWAEVTNSKDVVVAVFCGEKGLQWIMNKLKEEGCGQEDNVETS